MTITLDAKRRLTVPLPLMAEARPGDVFVARFDAEEDTLTFRRLPPREDWLKVAALCPAEPKSEIRNPNRAQRDSPSNQFEERGKSEPIPPLRER